MADIIQLLPDNIANQIAAGEVIQRPASVVKELLENAIDAQSTEVKLIIKDAGKTLIQVIDDGLGMSDTDARIAFERHATSKIRKASDLFHINTKGFRGEALASIAAIAQVELITKRAEDELGKRLLIEGSKVKKQEACQSFKGSTFSVKNLFYNVPARRKFLKSDPVELKHIMEEFKRVALAHPSVSFSLYHNDQEVYILPSSNLRQRVVGVMGKTINEKLVPLEQQTEIIKLDGYVGKPEAAKRTKGDQYLFVNNRYIKSNYLSHAIKTAYEEMIPDKTYPLYVIYLSIDPAEIDINVHPTKTEIKFENERIIYNYIKVAVKHALGQYSIAPLLDFDSDANFTDRQRTKESFPSLNNEYNYKIKSDRKQKDSWEELYKVLKDTEDTPVPRQESIILSSKITNENEKIHETDQDKEPYQIHSSYILSHIKNGYLLIDQQSAHERILYERNLQKLKGKKTLTQKELFPITVELDKSRATLLGDILPHITKLGFEIERFGGETFLIHGVPAELDENMDSSTVIEELIDKYIEFEDLNIGIDENISRSMAVSSCIKRGKSLTNGEMRLIIDELFGCENPYSSPSGRKCFVKMELDELFNKFNQ